MIRWKVIRWLVSRHPIWYAAVPFSILTVTHQQQTPPPTQWTTQHSPIPTPRDHPVGVACGSAAEETFNKQKWKQDCEKGEMWKRLERYFKASFCIVKINRKARGPLGEDRRSHQKLLLFLEAKTFLLRIRECFLSSLITGLNLPHCWLRQELKECYRLSVFPYGTNLSRAVQLYLQVILSSALFISALFQFSIMCV